MPTATLSAPRVETTTGIAGLTATQIDQIGVELDAIREREMADRGDVDAHYIRRMVKLQRSLEVGGRGMLYLGFLPPFWVAGVAALATSKILDNMEIGHNVMHGQYDWMNDPALSSKDFEWDTASPAEQWRHSHNYLHHTWTNVLGMDRDIGYGILRMDESQRWHPIHLMNPVNAFLLAVFFQWGVALHDLEVENLRTGRKQWSDVADLAKVIRRKGRRQVLKDYVLFPVLAGPMFVSVLLGNAAANLIRNLWSFTIIFCGHFPDGVQTFSKQDIEGETRGGWYVRQMLGSANITGGKVFHVMSGNLSHQIEHHLFPDLPARRYASLSPEVQAICERNGLPYTTGRLSRQFATVIRRIVALGLPPKAAKVT